MPDRRSVVFSGAPKKAGDTSKDLEAFRALIRNVATARKRDWGTAFEAVARALIAAVLDNREDHYGKLFAKDFDAAQLQIIQNSRFAAVGIEVGEGRPVRLVLDAKSDAAAPDLEKAMDGVLCGSLVALSEHVEPDTSPDAKKLVSELWKSRKMNRSGARLEWLGYSSVCLHSTCTSL